MKIRKLVKTTQRFGLLIYWEKKTEAGQQKSNSPACSSVLCFKSTVHESSSKADRETDGRKEEERETGVTRWVMLSEFREGRRALIGKKKKSHTTKKAKPASCGKSQGPHRDIVIQSSWHAICIFPPKARTTQRLHILTFTFVKDVPVSFLFLAGGRHCNTDLWPVSHGKPNTRKNLYLHVSMYICK